MPETTINPDEDGVNDMPTTIHAYLSDLRMHLSGEDPAVVMDALIEVEQHLGEASLDLLERGEATGPSEAMTLAIERFGPPLQVAAGYAKEETWPTTPVARSTMSPAAASGADPAVAVGSAAAGAASPPSSSPPSGSPSAAEVAPPTQASPSLDVAPTATPRPGTAAGAGAVAFEGEPLTHRDQRAARRAARHGLRSVRHVQVGERIETIPVIISEPQLPRSGANLFYNLAALPVGVILFTYVVTGLSVSLGMVSTIIGIPLAIAFLMSIRPIGYVYGRYTELMTGVRMPRRFRQVQPEGDWKEKILTQLKDPMVYSTMVFMLLSLVTGVLSFTIVVTLFSVAISLAAWPLVRRVLERYGVEWEVTTGDATTQADADWINDAMIQYEWGVLVAGVLMLWLAFRVSNVLAISQAYIAKAMLVRFDESPTGLRPVRQTVTVLA